MFHHFQVAQKPFQLFELRSWGRQVWSWNAKRHFSPFSCHINGWARAIPTKQARRIHSPPAECSPATVNSWQFACHGSFDGLVARRQKREHIALPYIYIYISVYIIYGNTIHNILNRCAWFCVFIKVYPQESSWYRCRQGPSSRSCRTQGARCGAHFFFARKDMFWRL